MFLILLLSDTKLPHFIKNKFDKHICMSTSVEFDHCIGLNCRTKNGLIYHPNGQNFLYSSGGNIIIGDLTDPNVQHFLRKHDDIITSLALSPSGKYIASGQLGENSNIHVWDFEERRLLMTLEEHDHMVQCMSFSHDEKLLATLGGFEDGKLIIWDLSNSCIVGVNNKLPAGTVAISNGGFVKDIKRRNTENYLLCTGGKEGLMGWDLNPYTGDLIPLKLNGDPRATPTRQITDVAFSEDKELIFGSTTSGDFVVANVRYQRIVSAIPATKMGLGCILGFRGGVIVGGGDSFIKVFNREFELQNQTQLDGAVTNMSLSPDSLEIIASTSNGTIYRVNIAAMQHITIAESHTGKVLGVALSPFIRDRFATASDDGTIRVWDLVDYIVQCTAFAISNQPRGAFPLVLGFSDVVISGWNDGRVLAHNPDDGSMLWFIDNCHPEAVTALTISHNNRFLLTGGPAGEVRLWELRTRDLISHLKEHVQKVTSIVLVDDDTQAISASRDRCILRWDLKNERRTHCHNQRMGGINSIALSADGASTISVGQERRLTYWDNSSESFSHQVSLDGERDEGKSVALSHNGQLVATGGSAGILRLWDYASGQLIKSLTGHSGCINSASFTFDDKQIITVGDDGSIFTWIVFSE